MLSKIMYGLNFMLADADDVATDLGGADWAGNVFKAIYRVIDDILWPVFGIIAVLGIVYAIVLGVNYAKAETSDKKEEAKKRIINAVVGVVVMLALIIILKVFIGNLDAVKTWVGNKSSASD